MTTPSFSEASRVFARIGLLSFGGPAAQMALMHRELVEDTGWITEEQYLSALSFCMLLPGPEAMQVATYTGWKLHGVRGGLMAGLWFVLPGAAVIMALAGLYAVFGAIPIAQALFTGIKAAVVTIVLEALLKIAKRALKTRLLWAVAILAFIAIFALGLPYPLIIACAAAVGMATAWSTPPTPVEPTTAPPTVLALARTIVTWGGIWAAPLVLLWAINADGLLSIGLFFSQLAVVTFGGAYAVLAYMTQEAVSTFGWLTTEQMIDGLGLAETTPGPLILVTQFVGFLAGTGMGGLALGFIAACLTLWVTFVPCFLWIFAGAPYIELIPTRPRLRGALTGVTAAVVGVVLNLSVWFALHVIFDTVTQTQIGPMNIPLPAFDSLNIFAVILSVIAGYLILIRKMSIVSVLIILAILGVGTSWL